MSDVTILAEDSVTPPVDFAILRNVLNIPADMSSHITPS